MKTKAWTIVLAFSLMPLYICPIAEAQGTAPNSLSSSTTTAQTTQNGQGDTKALTAENSTGADLSLQEIIVTAQRRSENSQRVPLAVTVFDGQSLDAHVASNIVDLAVITPGLQLSNANGTLVPFLRGIGDAANPIGNEASVAVYVDGVYYSRLPIGFFSLADVERVEVLKGPQGTLFGRNSTGGVIQIITPDPSHTTELVGHIGYGAFNTVRGDTYATTGLSERIAADISISGTNQADGYGRNITTDTKSDYQDDFTVRSKLLFEPSDKTKILLSGFYSYEQVGALGNTYPGTTQGFLTAPFTEEPRASYYDQHSDIPDNYNTAKAGGVSMKLDQILSFASFRSITSYLHDTEYQLIDSDYTSRPDARADVYGEVEEFTQEVQLASLPSSTLTWIAGLFYYNAFDEYDPLRLQGPAFIPGTVLNSGIVNKIEIFGHQRAESYAGYAQATYEILPKLNLTGGIRDTEDRNHGAGETNVSINNGAIFVPGAVTTAHDHANKVTYRTAIDYSFTSDVLAYVSFSRGYRSSTYNLLPFSGAVVKPEFINAYELGLKSELYDRRLRLNAAIFQYNVSNPQVQLVQNGAIILSNAQSSQVKGAEFEGELIAAHGLTFNFSATYLNSEYTGYGSVDPATGACVSCAPSSPPNFNPPYGTLPTIAIDATGNRTPLAPKWTANVGVQYTVQTAMGEWNLSADYYYNSGFFWEPDNFLQQDSYNIFNAQLQYKPNARFSIAIWGKNLSGAEYATFAASEAGPSGYPYLPAPPRTVGVTAGFGF